jgi:3-oxoacyl-[acyl-carrier-protein] synthase II
VARAMDVVVTGMGLRSALGDRRVGWQALLRGRSGIVFAQPFPELPLGPLAMIGTQPLTVLPLTVDLLTMALVDAKLAGPLPDCGVVVGSSRSCQGDWENWLSQGKSPDSWPDSWLEHLPNAPAHHVAQLIETQSFVFSPMAACATGLWAIAQGAEQIRLGLCDRVVAGAVEAPITPLTLAGFSQMGALAEMGAYPFDHRRSGFVLGEGGAILVLEREDVAMARGAKIYGRILGAGFTADAYHRNAPDPDGKTIRAAVGIALAQAGLGAQEIDYIHAHGTGTALNDQTEARLIAECFPHRPWVSSTKGATGHTLGASGAIGVAFSLLALQWQTVPPNVGMREPAFDLNIPIALRAAHLRRALCLGLGFGGQNGAIVVGP